MAGDFEPVIGIEVHAQIAVKSKMFCSCSTDAFNAEPNSNVCPVCMGFPGQLPVVNGEAIRKGLIAALALQCRIPEKSKFDRKNYFYPDLPKGFQISQYDEPISLDGKLTLDTGKMIRIRRLHLEDDAGKLTHIAGGTLCDYNRSGIPLMEIVTEPDIENAKEASEFAKTLQTILRYVGSSEADMEKGMMRFDASVSLRRRGEKKLYPRAEIKNLNSYKSLEAAINYEIERQKFLWGKNEPPKIDTTVGWADDRQETYLLREKESSADYRYFPEPDLPVLVTTAETVEQLTKEVPELPSQKSERYQKEWKLQKEEVNILTADPDLANYFEIAVKISEDAKKVSSLVTTQLLGYLNATGKSLQESLMTAEQLGRLVKMVNAGVISFNMAKNEVFQAMMEIGKDPEIIVQEKGLKLVSDESTIKKACHNAIESHPSEVAELKAGKEKLFGFFVGLAMKELKGQGSPEAINRILKNLLK